MLEAAAARALPGPRIRAASPAAAQARAAAPLTGRGWGAYLVLAALLAPIVRPSGPGQIAILDVANAVAIGVFLVVVMVRQVPVTLPFMVPALLVAAGTLLAVPFALSVGVLALTAVQDIYLFLWFVMLVALLARRGDTRAVRLAWMWAGVAVALHCAWQTVSWHALGKLASEDYRTYSVLTNSNMAGDFLMLSIFVVLSLAGQVPRLVLLGAAALLAFGLVTTKSNGCLLSLAGGLAVWGGIRAWADRPRRAAHLGLAAVGVAGMLLVGWVMSEGLGTGTIHGLQHSSFLGRTHKSTVSRAQIWRSLTGTMTRSPLGIGAGNSQLQRVPIGEQEKYGSFHSKEAHSDYVGALVERGPLGLLGFLLFTVQAFFLTAASRRARGRSWRVTAITAALLGGLTASTLHSFVIEKLHFRHFWLFLALAAAPAAAGLVPGEGMSETGRDPEAPCSS